MSRKDSKGRRLRDGEGQRKNGCYMYRYTDLLGARQVVYSWKLLPTDPLPKGKKEDVSLREKEKEIELMLKGEDSVQARTLTVNDVFDIYLRKKKHKGRALAETTKINYKSEWDKNIRNTVLGNKTIAEVRKAHVISLYENLLENGLSYGTVMFFHKLLNSVFNYAMDVLELIDKNPCRSALNSIEGSQVETKTLTKSQDQALMDYVRNYGGDMYVVFLLMRETMVRIGECIALTKSDIDTKNRSIIVDKQLQSYKADGDVHACLHISKTKGRNIRRIPLTDELYSSLLDLAEHTTNNLTIDGVNGFLFTKDGKAYTSSELRADMGKMVAEYNIFADDTDKIEGFTPKTLRHTGCTMYASEGMDVSVLQYIMGHKSSYTTMRFYKHVTEERVIDTFQDHINKNAQDGFEKHIHRSA